jgi:hypothetical protein
MANHVLMNSLGLIINILGSIIILRYGLPNRINPEGHTSIILQQVDQNEINKAKTYKTISSAGVILLIIGFLLQLASNFIVT